MKKWIEREAPRDGPNRRPTAGCLVVCHIIMSRLDGTVCQSSYDEDYQTQKVEPERLRLFCDEDHNGVPRSKKYLQGLHEGLASMRVGELAHFVMVPEKTFGRKGRYPAVPGYSKESPRAPGSASRSTCCRASSRTRTSRARSSSTRIRSRCSSGRTATTGTAWTTRR